METNEVFILLGSNLGDRKETLAKAIKMIGDSIGPMSLTSNIYETAPWGNTNQPGFLNQVIKVKTHLAAKDILDLLLQIETQLGRIRYEKWGARSIDLDILFFNSEIIQTPNLQIPHPGIPNRRFTLVPLAEIAPDWIHPILKLSMAALLNRCTDNEKVEVING